MNFHAGAKMLRHFCCNLKFYSYYNFTWPPLDTLSRNPGWCFPPRCPHTSQPGRGLPGEQLHPGHIAHEGHDLITGLVRLSAVLLDRGNNELMDVCRLPFRVSPCRQQANLRVAPRPKAQAIKPALGLSVFFSQHESHRLILKAPCLDQPQGLRELRERSPQKSTLSGAARSATGSAHISSIPIVG